MPKGRQPASRWQVAGCLCARAGTRESCRTPPVGFRGTREHLREKDLRKRRGARLRRALEPSLRTSPVRKFHLSRATGLAPSPTAGPPQRLGVRAGSRALRASRCAGTRCSRSTAAPQLQTPPVGESCVAPRRYPSRCSRQARFAASLVSWMEGCSARVVAEALSDTEDISDALRGISPGPAPSP